jgi:c-di-GMP-binding flagellar brake protein YcgR
MALHKKNSLDQKSKNSWQPLDDNRETTTSKQIITNNLSWLKSNRVLLTLLHQGYQSGSTMVMGYNDKELEIDKPDDWPNSETSVKVIYKDKRKIWNYFTVDVTRASGEALFTVLPRSLYRLQRRAHFRVDTPLDSQAHFIAKGATIAMVNVQDISAGGLQLRSKAKLPLSAGDQITEIAVKIPGGNVLLNIESFKDLVVRIQEGWIAWSGKSGTIFCYGIGFNPNEKEEELLLRYVRQREIELLRRALDND